MNKAFVREPDDDGRRYCPQCGSLGESVSAATLANHLLPDASLVLGDAAYFCPLASCSAVYFDDFGRSVSADRLTRPVYPKDRDAPICGCFGLTEADIEDDLREQSTTRVKALLAKAKSADARCAEMAANGRSCVAEVQRYYIKRRG
jgi:hypothetical protein